MFDSIWIEFILYWSDIILFFLLAHTRIVYCQYSVNNEEEQTKDNQIINIPIYLTPTNYDWYLKWD